MPNNSWDTATPLSLVAPVSLGDSVSASAPDFYRFTLPGRSSFNLKLTGLSGNADVTLFDNSGTVIQQSLNQGTLAEEISTSLLGAGTYYVRVMTTAGGAVNYTLGLQAQNNPYTGIVWRNYMTGDNRVWQISSSGAVVSNMSTTATTELNWRIEATGDFNGDGQQDLVWRRSPTGEVRIWTMNGSTVLDNFAGIGTVADPWQICGTGDFNNDGQTDLVWRNQTSGQSSQRNVVWFMNGTTVSGWTYLPDLVDPNWQLRGIGDFNSDGRSDLVWRNSISGDNVVWFLNGTTFASPGSTYLQNLSDTNWQLQGVGDLTGDGRPDLFWRNIVNGQNVIWKMNGTTVESSYFTDQVTDTSWQAVAPLSGFAAPTPIDGAGNSPATAFNIGSLNGTATYGERVGNGDEDYYQFSLARATRVSGVLSGAGVNVDFGGNGVSVALGTGSNVLLSLGTYWARVFSTDGANHDYSLQLTPMQPLSPSQLNLAAGSDSGVSQSDRVTNVKTPMLTGVAEANSWVQVFNGSQFLGETTANGAGAWQFTPGTALGDGSYSLTAQAVNNAGAVSAASATLALTIDSLIPQLSLSTPLSQLTAQSRLTGSISGTGSAMATLKYRFDTSGVEVDVALGINGTFDKLLDLTGLSNGNHTLNIIGTDFAGNISTTQVAVVVGDQRILSEGTGFQVQQSTSLNLSQLRGIVSFDIDAQFDRTDQTAVTEDRFLVYLVGDPSLPSQTLLGKPGVSGGTVFSLTEKQAEFVPGLVSFDGKTVQIDLSSLTTQTQATLIFQLVNNDADSGTSVKVENIAQRTKVADIGSRVDSPVTVAPVAGAITLSSLSSTTDLKVQLSDIRVDAVSGRYTARLQVRNTGTVATGRQIAVLFPNLPNDVQLRSPSGLDANGKPYINLRSAIPTQGLAPGASSDLVEVSFDNPRLIKINLQSQVFTGGVNRAPTLQPIAPITLYPGAYSEVPIQATDADGDAVVYSIAFTGNTPPPVTIGSGGKLIFRPTAAQVNQTFNFFVVVSDGITEARQAVTLSVAPDPITTTRISGKVQQSSGQPPASLAGIAVTWGNLTATTSTDGSFTLVVPGTLPTGTLKVNGKQANISGVSYSDTIVDVAARLGHAPYAGNNNQLQSIYLTTLDTTRTIRTTDPATGKTTLTNSAIAGVSLTIPPGALTDANGNPYTGSTSITQPDAARLPAALPEGVSSNSIISVDLGTANCNAPLPLQAPNPTPYVGLVDLYGLRSDGSFGIVGTGRTVSGSGGSYFVSDTGISGPGLYFFAPKALQPKSFSDIDRNPDEVCESCVVHKRLHSDASVELHSGAVLESQELVGYESLGSSRGIQLKYDSMRADPRPIVHFGYSDIQVQSGRDNYRLIAKMKVNLKDGSTYEVPGYQGTAYGLTGGEHLWKLPDGTTVDGSLQIDLRQQQSGIYTYDLTSGIKVLCDCVGNEHFYGSSQTQKDELIIVNGIQNPFGSGWGMAGWQELVEGTGKNQQPKVLLIDGDGSQLLFTQSGSSYLSPEGDFSRLEKVNGLFQRTTKDGTIYQFNAQNKLATVTNRNGLVTTTYQYTGTQLTKIIDAAGLETVLTYANGRVASVTDPVVLSANPADKRITQFYYDANGNLIKVTNPDNTSRTFSYDDQHHLINTTDPIGNQSGPSGHTAQVFYDFAGRATQAIDRDGSLIRVKPSQVQGLRRPNETIVDPLLSPIGFTTHNAQADYFDANGNLTRVQLDRSQQEKTSTDSFGTSTQLERTSGAGSNRYLVTASTDARGNRTTYTYDDRGNVTEVRDSLAAGSPVSDTLFPQALYQGDSKAVVVDWNGDGNLDLVSSFNSQAAIFYGDGRGNFSGAQVTTAKAITDIAVGDLNGDGRLDIVSGNYSSNKSVSVQLQRADGSFSVTDLTIPANKGTAYLIGMTDLDGDGDLDLYSGLGYGVEAGTGRLQSNLGVWVNTGQGNFASAVVTTLLDSNNGSPVLFSITSGDVNGDGLRDFAVTNSNSTSSIVLGQGTQNAVTYALQSTFANGKQPELKDLNSDGKLDLVTLSNDSTSIQYRPGNGNGTFGSLIAISTGLSSNYSNSDQLTVADVNGDGKLDLIAANSSQISVQLGQGVDLSNNATFAPAQVYAPAGQTSFLIGDFNSQVQSPSLLGKLDLLFIDPYSTTNLLLNQGDGTFTARSTTTSTDYAVGNTPTDVVVGDVNGDGTPDVLVANESSNTVSVRLGNGTGAFPTSTNEINVPVGVNVTPIAIALGDLNRDGKLDFVTANQNGSFTVALGNGQGGFTITTSATTSLGGTPSDLALGDVTGDGILDLMVTNRGAFTERISVLKGNEDGTFLAKADFAAGSQPAAIATGDLNGDGNLDLVVTNSISLGTVSVLLGNGNGTFPTKTSYAVGNQPRGVTLGDINGDGKLDIVSANAGGDTVSVLLGTGIGTFGTKTDFAVGSQPRAVSLGDVNGDGKLDILVANYAGASVSVLLGTGGTGLFAPQTNFAFKVGSSPIAIALADLDQDGSLDFVTANAGASTISPRLNDRLRIGTPTGTGKHIYEYDTKFNPVTGKFEGRYTTRFNQLTREVDELGRQTIFELDPTKGNVVRAIRVIGTIDSQTKLNDRSGDDLITTYTYTPDGRVATETDALGRTTRYNYDIGALNPFKNLRQVTVALGTADEATQWFEYDAAGNQSAAIDALGRRSEWLYDLKTNRLLEMVAADPDGPAGPLLSPRTRYEYDANGNLTTTIDARGFVSKNVYDGMDRLRQAIGADPDAAPNPAGRVEVDLTSTSGLRSSIATYEYDLNGNLIQTTDPLGRITKSSYDARNRLATMTLPDLSVQQTGYDLDNNTIRSTDANQQSSRSALDARGRRVLETDALGNKTRFVYDAADQLVAQVDAKGQVTRYAYDELGRQVRVTDGQGNVTRTEYDKNGNVTASIDPLGNRTQYEFDKRDRQIRTLDANNFNVNGTPIANPKATVTAYDAVGNVRSVTDPAGNTTSYLYDGLNRLTTETNALNQSRLFSYDENGNRTRVTDRNAKVRTFEFDGLNRLTHERWIGGE